MNKLNTLIIMTPIFMNILMIFMMTTPLKISKLHPISLLILLISVTFMICLQINFFKKSMTSYILFLTMIGGLMVIFMYITSLSNNELFSFNYSNLLINLIKTITLTILYITLTILFDQISFNNLIESFQLNEMNDNFKYINIMYKESYNKSSIFIMIYLYYSMICIMNICYKFKSPLRQLLF